MTRSTRQIALAALPLIALAAAGHAAPKREALATPPADAGATADPAPPSSIDSAKPPADATAPASTPVPTASAAVTDAAQSIAANVAASRDHTTLLAAVKAAGLDATLAGPGPFTVFAPTNEAFGRLAPGTVETLMKPENKATLVKLLGYHVVKGKLNAEELRAKIAAGGGTATLDTVAGQPLKATSDGAAIKLTDANGNVSFVQTADLAASNGIIHVVNGVVVPKL